MTCPSTDESPCCAHTQTGSQVTGHVRSPDVSLDRSRSRRLSSFALTKTNSENMPMGTAPDATATFDYTTAATSAAAIKSLLGTAAGSTVLKHSAKLLPVPFSGPSGSGVPLERPPSA